MINKQSLWFLTLFSLILVLSVYYITMPSDILLTSNGNYNTDDDATVLVVESEILTALRVESEDERMGIIEGLEIVLTNVETTVEDKNNAFEEIKYLNLIRGKEEVLEQKLKEEFSINSFIKVDDDQIKIVVARKEHNAELANNIMRAVQSTFDGKKYISVKFQG